MHELLKVKLETNNNFLVIEGTTNTLDNLKGDNNICVSDGKRYITIHCEFLGPI